MKYKYFPPSCILFPSLEGPNAILLWYLVLSHQGHTSPKQMLTQVPLGYES